MIHEREYHEKAYAALMPVLHLLPPDVQRAVRLAESVLRSHSSCTPDELRAVIGSRNWVVARRSRRIVEKYGEDVVCLSQQAYTAAERKAVENRFPKEDAA